MRNLGVGVVLLGLGALGIIVLEATWAPVSGVAGQPTEPDNTIAMQHLIAWITFVTIAALITLAQGIRAVTRERLMQRLRGPVKMPDDETAAMIDAEVNEGGPPGAPQSDTSAERSFREKERKVMPETPPPTLEPCRAPDHILRLPLGAAVGSATAATLLRSDGLELIRLVIPAGKLIPPHKAPGEITIQCIEGQVAFEHDGRTLEMRPGDVLHLCPQEIHAIRGVADSSVLVTRLRPHAKEFPESLPSH